MHLGHLADIIITPIQFIDTSQLFLTFSASTARLREWELMKDETEDLAIMDKNQPYLPAIASGFKLLRQVARLAD